MQDPSIVEQLRKVAEDCEKGAADLLEKARRHRAAMMALDGASSAPMIAPSPVPLVLPVTPGTPTIIPCQRGKQTVCFCPACLALGQPIQWPIVYLGARDHGGNCACPQCTPVIWGTTLSNFTAFHVNNGACGGIPGTLDCMRLDPLNQRYGS